MFAAPDPEPIVNSCNNDAGEMILDCSIANLSTSPGDGWSQDWGFFCVISPKHIKILET